MIAFNPAAQAGQPDFGLLYVGVGDGGSGGDPNGHGQDLNSAFGKVLRIDPLGRNSTNGKYGVPPSNPFVADGNPATLGEIFAYGVRNPQHLNWDRRTGRMFLTDIGQDVVEELDTLSAGSNLGWNTWEGNYRFGAQRSVVLDNPRSDPGVSYPIAEYAQPDSLLQGSSAASGLAIVRGGRVPQIENMVLWCDLVAGEIFYLNADRLPSGGQDGIRRVLLNDGGTAKTLLQVIRERNQAQGRQPPSRVDLRLGSGPNGEVYLLNKADGVIRVITAAGGG
jgi:glucose/arabinose dehydrogenase